MLKNDSNAKDGCRAPRPGEIFKNPTLANTFRLMAKHGKKGFYEGEVAEQIIKVVTDLGGRLTLDDLKHHAETGTEEVDAISLKVDGLGLKQPIVLWEHPPNGQGLVALIALGILQEWEKAGKIKTFTKEDQNSTEYCHAIIEALRLAFSDAVHFISDPNVVPVPIKELLSSAYLADRGSVFSSNHAIESIRHGTPLAFSSDTVYFSVTDPEGNACSFIISNYAGFGTGIIPKGCGFTLQNRGANFTLQPADHPNVLAPRKRPYHTIIPAMITNLDGSLNTCFGVMGGFMQPQGHIQVIMNMFVFGMNPQEALDSPRVCVETIGSDSVSKTGDLIYLEEGMPEATVEGLKKLGHNVIVLTGHQRQQFGRGQIIRRSEEEGQLIWSAGSDQRGDGHASPL
jgi:gamma-glutamyltranspeptidase/glutathione hydrolase